MSNRREFLKQFITASSVAVAAHFGVSNAVAEEMQEEFLKDFSRTSVAMPGEHRPVWASVADTVDVWTTHLMKDPLISSSSTGRRDDTADALIFAVRGMCKRMAKAIDHDLCTSRVEEGKKIFVEVPKVRRSSGPLSRLSGDFELVAGLETKKTIWGEELRVGYIQEGIITGEEVDSAKRGLFGLHS